MNFTTTHIRSEKVTIDTRIYTILNGRKKPGEVYLAAIAPDMELTIITLDEAPDILPCFDEDDACLNLPNTSLLLCYNPAQVLKMGGKHYLTGPVILVRTNMDGDVISLTIDEVYLFQKYLASHSITLMADDQRLPPGSVQKGTAQLQGKCPSAAPFLHLLMELVGNTALSPSGQARMLHPHHSGFTRWKASSACAQMQISSGPNVASLVPATMPVSTAHATAFA